MKRALLLLAAACAGDPGQHEITSAGELLTPDGRLREPGWAPRQLLRWDPARVADPSRLRQWDFFTVLDERAAVNLTLADLGFVQTASVGVVDLATGEKTETTVLRGAGDDFSLSAGLEGSASLGQVLRFATGPDGSTLTVDIPGSFLGPAARGTLAVHRRPAMPYLSLATPFAEDPHDFFFEQKVPGQIAEGTLTVGERSYTFAGATAVTDWGRGQWPARVTWRWAAASGDGVALNLGEGFGDAAAGSENLAVVDDQPMKLGAVAWTFDPADPMRDWTFRSGDGRVDLVLHPVAPETGGLELGSKFQRVTKAYGRFTGRVGSRSVDGILGFAESVDISW